MITGESDSTNRSTSAVRWTIPARANGGWNFVPSDAEETSAGAAEALGRGAGSSRPGTPSNVLDRRWGDQRRVSEPRIQLGLGVRPKPAPAGYVGVPHAKISSISGVATCMAPWFAGRAKAQPSMEAAMNTSTASTNADVLVIFGITGDLARVMTFRSLYRLELRGLLDCPIVGVAGDDWALERLVQRARDSIVATGEVLDEEASPGLPAGSTTSKVTSGTPAPTSGWPTRSARRSIRCSTWRSRRSCSAGWSRAWPRPG